jgi:hypothetical protein
MYFALGPSCRRAGVLDAPRVASVAPSQYFRQPTRVNEVSVLAADCVEVTGGDDAGVCAIAVTPAIAQAAIKA